MKDEDKTKGQLLEEVKTLRDDLTEMERVESQRKQAEEALRYRVTFEDLITTISTRFINLSPDEVDKGIDHALQEIGKFANVERSYIFLFSDDSRTKIDNTHEWCVEGIEAQIDRLKGLPVKDFPWWMEKIERFEHIYIPRVAGLPPQASAEKEILQSQAIKSLVVVPMVFNKQLIGFLGFDSVRSEKKWSEDIISLLRIVGETFANALECRRAEKEQRILQEQLDEALTKILGGFINICAKCKRIHDDNGDWIRIEHYITAHTKAAFSHGLCPECLKELYPDYKKTE